MSSPGEERAASRPDTGEAARIPTQTTVTAAPENTPLGSAGRAGDRAAAGDPAASAAVSLPPAPVPVAEAAPPVPATAGVATRTLAAAVDAIAVVVLAVLLDLGAAGARFLWSPSDFRWPRPTAGVMVELLLAIAVVYLTVGWALAGRTYGSKLLGLRVLSSRHELMGWARSVCRALVCVVWPVGLLWSGISASRHSVADLVVRTVVVYDDRPYVRAPDGS